MEHNWPPLAEFELFDNFPRNYSYKGFGGIMADWFRDYGYWPIPIWPIHYQYVPKPGKAPIGKEWGRQRHTKESLWEIYRKHPWAGVGVKLGPDGRLIDIDIDDPV